MPSIRGRFGVIANLFGTYGFEKGISSGMTSFTLQVFGIYDYIPAISLFAGLGMRRHHTVHSSLYPMIGISWQAGINMGKSMKGARRSRLESTVAREG